MPFPKIYRVHGTCGPCTNAGPEMRDTTIVILVAPALEETTYRNRANKGRSRLVAAPLRIHAKKHFLCVFYVII